MIVKKAELDQINEQQIRSLEEFLTLGRQTVENAQAVITENEAELEVVMSNIDEQEMARDIAAEDRDVAQADLDEETERWDIYVVAYEEFIAELQAELDAID